MDNSKYRINTITCTIPILKCTPAIDINGITKIVDFIKEDVAYTDFVCLSAGDWFKNKASVTLKYKTKLHIVITSSGIPHIVGANLVEDLITVGNLLLHVFKSTGQAIIDTSLVEIQYHDILCHMINCSRINKLHIDTDIRVFARIAHEHGLHCCNSTSYNLGVKILYYSSANSPKCTCECGIHKKIASSTCNKVTITVFSTGTILIIGANVNINVMRKVHDYIEKIIEATSIECPPIPREEAQLAIIEDEEEEVELVDDLDIE